MALAVGTRFGPYEILSPLGAGGMGEVYRARDPKLTALAAFNYLYAWDWAGAEVEFKRAIELNPNFPDVRSLYSHYLMIMKRPEEAMAEIQRALQLDPLNELVHIHHAFLLESAGRYDEAIVQLRNLLGTSTQNPMAHWGLSISFFRKAKYEESLAEMKAYYAGDHEMEEALTKGYAQLRYRGAMSRAADLLAARGRTTYVLPNDVASLYAIAGEKVQALQWLEKGFEARDPNMPYLNLYPEFETLRSEPRFQALVRKMGLPEVGAVSRSAALKALELDPNLADGLYVLECAYEGKKMFDEV